METSYRLSNSGERELPLLQKPSTYLIIAIIVFLSVKGEMPWGVKNGGDYLANPSSVEIGATKQIANLSAWFFGCILMIPSIYKIINKAIYAPALLAVTGLAIASIAWSQFPAITAVKAAVLLAETLWAIYLARKFTLLRFIELIQVATAVIVALCILWVVAYPSYGVNQLSAHMGSWEGIFVQKNIAATTLTFLLPAFFISIDKESRNYRIFRRLAGTGTFIFILMTRSATGIGIAVLLVCLMLTLRTMRRFSKRESFSMILLLFIAFLVVGVIVVLNIDTWFKLIGRDMTFSGRTVIWAAVFQLITERPLGGYGYGAFWVGMKGAASDVILSAGYAVGYAHNGFLDVWLQVGIVGLILVVIMLIHSLQRSIIGFWRDWNQYADWCLAISFLTVLFNLDEGTLLMPNSLLWVLFIVVYLNVTKRRQISAEKILPLKGEKRDILRAV